MAIRWQVQAGRVCNRDAYCSRPSGTRSNFHRTAAGAEIDLLLTPPGDRPWAIEIKRSLTPKVGKGFYLACEDIKPARRIVVYPGTQTFPLRESVEAMALKSAAQDLLDLS